MAWRKELTLCQLLILKFRKNCYTNLRLTTDHGCWCHVNAVTVVDAVVLEAVLAVEREGTKHVQLTRFLLIPMVSMQSLHLFDLAPPARHVVATRSRVGEAMWR